MLDTLFSPWPSYTKEEAEAVTTVLLSNRVNYWTGKQCKNFELEFAQFFNSKYSISLANGTLALELALKALEIGDGDEVIVTSRTYIASVSCIVNCGATPIFIDVDLESQNINPQAIHQAISKRTKGIICVHLAGWACEMDEIMSIANEYSISVIEDCAQAHGAKYADKSVGTIGHIGCWSFCQDKIMTTGGEGGMVTTNDEILWRKMWAYKDHGKSYAAVYERKHQEGFRWLHESFGTNMRMTEIQATIGRFQLKKMPDWHNKRLKNASIIWNAAMQCKGLRVPYIPNHIDHAAYKCYVFVRPEYFKKGWNRDRVIIEINKLGVPCYSGSCSEVYLEKAFSGNKYRPERRLTNAKELGETSLMFLVHPTLTEDEVHLTCDVIISVMELATK